MDSRSCAWSICRRYVVVEMTRDNVRHDKARVPSPNRVTLAVDSIVVVVDAGTVAAAAVVRPEKSPEENRK